MPKTSTPDHPWRARVAALVVGIALGVGVAIAVWPSDEVPPPSDTSTDAAARFLAAWQRARTATFTAEGTFRREAGESVIDDEVVVVQRPPDRLTLGFGSWDGVVGGRKVNCVRDGRSGEWSNCDGTGAGDLESIDAPELAELRDLVDPAEPTYRVSELEEGCFRMRLVTDVRFTPDYGERAEVCFDAATGAIERLLVEREESEDLTTFDRITPAVDPADLAVPPPP